MYSSIYLAPARFVPPTQALLGAGAAVSHRNGMGQTPLFYAAVEGPVPVIKALLSAGAETEEVDEDGDTPLLAAAANGKVGFGGF